MIYAMLLPVWNAERLLMRTAAAVSYLYGSTECAVHDAIFRLAVEMMQCTPDR